MIRPYNWVLLRDWPTWNFFSFLSSIHLHSHTVLYKLIYESNDDDEPCLYHNILNKFIYFLGYRKKRKCWKNNWITENSSTHSLKHKTIFLFFSTSTISRWTSLFRFNNLSVKLFHSQFVCVSVVCKRL